jgi:hypothetical protein
MKTTNPLLEISGDKVDGGELVGRRPSEVPPQFLSLKFTAQNPMRAIRAKCLDCCCSNAAEVRKCVATHSHCGLSGLPPIRSEKAASFPKTRSKGALRSLNASIKGISSQTLERLDEICAPDPGCHRDRALFQATEL